MSLTDNVVAKATDGLDDNLQPDNSAPKDAAPEAPVEPESPAEAKEPKEDKGFSADELADTEEESVVPAEAKEIDTASLSDEGKYIFDNLPYITARVKDGDTIKELQVKSWTQLPDNLEFATKRDELAFINALQAQENRATMLQAKFQQDQQGIQTKEFEQREDAMIREDVAALQKEGELPRFKAKLDDPKFDEDPATQEVQKIMDFMEERNKQYLAEYQQGRPFRHIGFREAFYMYQRNNPHASEQAEEDAERKKVAEGLNNTRGLTSREVRKPTVRSGTRISDILDRIDAENW